MKKIMMFAFAVLVFAGMAMAQVTYTQGTGITQPIDKLGAHQNGGRGCVGCHAPHSGARGNGGTLRWDSTSQTFVNQPVIGEGPDGDSGGEALWGQDIGPIIALGSIDTGDGTNFPVSLTEQDLAARPRVKTGVVFCLSCHDGNVAKGAMMTNQSFEQAFGLLPDGYGGQPIPTLLGNDGGSLGNYHNDHPIGPEANIAALGSITSTTSGIGRFLTLDTPPTRVMPAGSFAGSIYHNFQISYGLPSVIGARRGAGFAVETGMADVGAAYVVCTTCHTPHSMYTATSSGSNPIGGNAASGTYPSYFFVAAPYNPGADTVNGTKASSATQFCRQCHFTGAGGSNEASGILNILTAF